MMIANHHVRRGSVRVVVQSQRRRSSSAAAASVVTVLDNESYEQPQPQPPPQPPHLRRSSSSSSLQSSQTSRLEQLRTKLNVDMPQLNSFKVSPSKSSSLSSSSSKMNVKTKTNVLVNVNKTKESSVSIHELLRQLPPLSVAATATATASSSTSILTDTYHRPHSYLRISLTERCNLRCQYCMPPEGVPLQPESNLLQRHEIYQLTSIFAQNGVNKIRLTGGEPLLRKDLLGIVSDLQSIPGIEQIGMTTNGMTLSRQLSDLIDAGLTHVNISLDTLQEEKFHTLTRRPGLTKVLRSIEAAALAFPEGRVKINCVVVRNMNEDEMMEFCRLTTHLPVDVRFIEWMPFLDNGWSLQDGLVPYTEMLSRVQSEVTLERVVDGPNDTTKWWKLKDGGLGRIGFITSMSNHFCGTCNRLRLTADGKIKVCLFGSAELSLLDAIRDESIDQHDIERLIHYAVQGKHFALGGHGTAQGIATANDNRPMILIGG